MVRNQCPCTTGRTSLFKNCCKTPEKIVPITVIVEEDPPFNAPRHDVMHGSGSVDTGFAGHEAMIGRKLKTYRTSSSPRRWHCEHP